ncbi:Hypothetical predicted protein [Lecanosticta acicola]|uniref:Uncharacterized protein n=1 Tax=Lecanosticta acicola TaxID=111012 RepID=A0AAI8YR64_9PEZI|nr:Hypothetical predicted protein [Lecanosticta acicola]
MRMVRTPKPDHYDGNMLVAPHFECTPELTAVGRMYTKYGVGQQKEHWVPLAQSVRQQVNAIYSDYNLTDCSYHGLYIAGSERDVQYLDRDRMMILVIELDGRELRRWDEIDADMRSILDRHELSGHAGVCVRYYKRWNPPPRQAPPRQRGDAIPINNNAQPTTPPGLTRIPADGMYTGFRLPLDPGPASLQEDSGAFLRSQPPNNAQSYSLGINSANASQMPRPAIDPPQFTPAPRYSRPNRSALTAGMLGWPQSASSRLVSSAQHIENVLDRPGDADEGNTEERSSEIAQPLPAIDTEGWGPLM